MIIFKIQLVGDSKTGIINYLCQLTNSIVVYELVQMQACINSNNVNLITQNVDIVEIYVILCNIRPLMTNVLFMHFDLCNQNSQDMKLFGKQIPIIIN